MLDRVNALMESEDTQNLIANNEKLITEAVQDTAEFNKLLKVFVLDHQEEFLGENTETTYKNIRIFSEVATAQFMTEVTNIYGNDLSDPIQEAQQTIGDYL
jgi:hypothetical protein